MEVEHSRGKEDVKESRTGRHPGDTLWVLEPAAPKPHTLDFRLM